MRKQPEPISNCVDCKMCYSVPGALLCMHIRNRREARIVHTEGIPDWCPLPDAPVLQQHSNDLKLLDRYTKFLQKNGYIDTDATCEEPFAIDQFIEEESKTKKQ